MASNAGEALLLSERHHDPIHLLLTDVVMPNMNGRDLAERLAPLHPEMMVLYMSGYTEDIISHRGVLEETCCLFKSPSTHKACCRKCVRCWTVDAVCGFSVKIKKNSRRTGGRVGPRKHSGRGR